MVPLTVAAFVPLVVAPGAAPGAGLALLAPVVLVVSAGGVLIADVDDGDVEAVPDGEDVVVVVVVEAVVSVVVGVVVVVVLGVVLTVEDGVVVVVLVVVLLRSQPAAAVASAIAAAMGMRRFMNSPMCV